jgi:hypothetical protein
MEVGLPEKWFLGIRDLTCNDHSTRGFCLFDSTVWTWLAINVSAVHHLRPKIIPSHPWGSVGDLGMIFLC